MSLKIRVFKMEHDGLNDIELLDSKCQPVVTLIGLVRNFQLLGDSEIVTLSDISKFVPNLPELQSLINSIPQLKVDDREPHEKVIGYNQEFYLNSHYC